MCTSPDDDRGNGARPRYRRERLTEAVQPNIRARGARSRGGARSDPFNQCAPFTPYSNRYDVHGGPDVTRSRSRCPRGPRRVGRVNGHWIRSRFAAFAHKDLGSPRKLSETWRTTARAISSKVGSGKWEVSGFNTQWTLRSELLATCPCHLRPSQSSRAGRVFSTSLAIGRWLTGSSFRILPSRKMTTRFAKCAMSGSCVTSTIVRPCSFRS